MSDTDTKTPVSATIMPVQDLEYGEAAALFSVASTIGSVLEDESAVTEMFGFPISEDARGWLKDKCASAAQKLNDDHAAFLDSDAGSPVLTALMAGDDVDPLDSGQIMGGSPSATADVSIADLLGDDGLFDDGEFYDE